MLRPAGVAAGRVRGRPGRFSTSPFRQACGGPAGRCPDPFPARRPGGRGRPFASLSMAWPARGGGRLSRHLPVPSLSDFRRPLSVGADVVKRARVRKARHRRPRPGHRPSSAPSRVREKGAVRERRTRSRRGEVPCVNPCLPGTDPANRHRSLHHGKQLTWARVKAQEWKAKSGRKLVRQAQTADVSARRNGSASSSRPGRRTGRSIRPAAPEPSHSPAAMGVREASARRVRARRR